VRRIGLLTLPESQISQERALREQLDAVVANAEGGAGGDALERKMRVQATLQERLSTTEEWAKAAAASAEYQFAVADFPQNDKGIGMFLETINKVFGYVPPPIV